MKAMQLLIAQIMFHKIIASAPIHYIHICIAETTSMWLLETIYNNSQYALYRDPCIIN